MWHATWNINHQQHKPVHVLRGVRDRSKSWHIRGTSVKYNGYLKYAILLAAATFGAAGVDAGDIFVGGPEGVVFVGDSESGNFEFFGVCGGPIDSMTIYEGRLYLGDPAGVVYSFDLETTAFEGSFSISNDATAMVVDEGTLLISGSDGSVVRVDPITGLELETMTSPVDIWTMTSRDNFIYVGGPSMYIHRADTADGQFYYFACLCFGPTHSLTTTESHLYIGDEFNTIWLASLADGSVVNAFSTTEAPTAMLSEGDELIVASAEGNVSRVDNQTGVVNIVFNTPIEIQAMAAPPAPQCAGDVTGNGIVDLSDLSALLTNYGTPTGAYANDGDTDDDGDGAIGLEDLGTLLANYGSVCTFE